MNLSILNGRYHRATEPSPGIVLLEFNRYFLPFLRLVYHLLTSSDRPSTLSTMSENPSDSHTGNGAHNLGFMLGSMWAEFKSIVERISASPDVRVVILSSALERYFTAGLECEIRMLHVTVPN